MSGLFFSENKMNFLKTIEKQSNNALLLHSILAFFNTEFFSSLMIFNYRTKCISNICQIISFNWNSGLCNKFLNHSMKILLLTLLAFFFAICILQCFFAKSITALLDVAQIVQKVSKKLEEICTSYFTTLPRRG